MLGLSKRKTLKIISGVVMVLALIFSAIPYLENTAYAAPASSVTPSNGNGTQQSDQTAPVKCAVEKIGWFVCPVMEQVAKISDNSFQYLSGYFLSTNPALVGNNTGTQIAWNYARTVANVMFIIAFLIIILSQVTGYGISNYGLKKMIPRLLVAAIAVNVSYYLCQLAVDLSNIFGYAIEDALVQIANSIGPSVFGTATQLGAVNTSGSIGGGIATTIVVGVLATAAVVWIIMGPMMAIILMVIITLFTIIVILLLRKALIVLLVVISPIAIVMYLLPNTEGLFTKWRKMFINLLMVFPVVGLLFGAGQLASTIVLVAGAQQQTTSSSSGTCSTANTTTTTTPNQTQQQTQANTGDPTKLQGCQGIAISGPAPGTTYKPTNQAVSGGCSSGANCNYAVSWMLGLTALGIAAAPLIAVWSVLRGAISAAGAIGGKITSGISKGSGSLGLNKWAEGKDDARQDRMNLRSMQDRRFTGLVGRKYRKQAKRDATRSGVKKELGHATNQYIASEAAADGRFADRMAGGSLIRSAVPEAVESVQRTANATLRHDLEDAIKNAMHDVELQGSPELLNTIRAEQNSDGTFSAKGYAALQQLGKIGDAADIRRAVALAGASGDHEASRAIGQSLSANNPGYLGAGDLANISNGNIKTAEDYDRMVNNSIGAGTVTAAKLAGMSADAVGYVHSVAGNAAVGGGSDRIGQLVSSAIKLHGNNSINGTVGKQKNNVNLILADTRGSVVAPSGVRFS